MKVEIFAEERWEEAQKKINEWFSKGHVGRVQFITQSKGGAGTFGVIISIFYE